MITRAISSAARLPLAPAKLAAQMAGAFLRGMRGETSSRDTSSARRAGSKPARRSRAQAQSKRSSTRSSAKQQTRRRKQQPKRTTTRAQPKGQSSAARSLRTGARTSAQARPKRAEGTEPPSDVVIAREVESTIFRDTEADRGQVDVDVAEGVVRLRGEVSTPDLMNELEGRASRVPQVRRVENLLRTPVPTSEPATPEAHQADPASVRTTAMAGVAQGTEAGSAETSGGARAPRTGRWGDDAEPQTERPKDAVEPAGRPGGDESADQDEFGNAEPGKDRSG